MISNLIITGQSATVLNLLTIAILGFIVATGTIGFLLRICLAHANEYATAPRQSLLWLSVLAPWGIGGLTMLIFTPMVQNSVLFPWAMDIAHWHHPNMFELFSWHGVCLIIFCAWITGLFVRGVLKLIEHSRHITLLSTLSAKQDFNIYFLDSKAPVAFSTTYFYRGFKSIVVISNGLLSSLNQSEQQIVIQHELAHLKHRDPLKKWVFGILVQCFPKMIRNKLLKLMHLTLEQMADERVLTHNHSATEVAQTLLKATRIANSWREKCKNILSSTPELVLSFGIEAVEQRVRYLIEEKHYKPFPFWWMVVVAILIVILSTSAVDSLHHLIENLFIH